jgi:hypothetical protein
MLVGAIWVSREFFDHLREMTVTCVTIGTLDHVLDRRYDIEKSDSITRGSLPNTLAEIYKLWMDFATENVASDSLIDYAIAKNDEVLEALWQSFSIGSSIE